MITPLVPPAAILMSTNFVEFKLDFSSVGFNREKRYKLIESTISGILMMMNNPGAHRIAFFKICRKLAGNK